MLLFNVPLLLCLPQQKHASHLLARDLRIKSLSDLLQRKAEIFERQNAMQPGELTGGVVAIASSGINMRRLQQSHLVIKP